MRHPSSSDLVYLSDREIADLRIPPGRLRAALRRAYGLHGAAEPAVQPKHSLALGPGHFFQSMGAGSSVIGYAAHKWVGVAAGNASSGLATVNSLVVLSDFATGHPVAVLSGNELTVMRTAALSALAAEYLARPDSVSVGFIGCGRQALGHLPALLDVLPSLRSAVCVSGSPASAATLGAAAAEAGLAARIASDPAEALACDVLVTSVRTAGSLAPFLDAGHVPQGNFTTAVDAGASWRPDTFPAFDILATDDRRQAEEPSTKARLAAPRAFDADLSELVCGRWSGRRNPAQKALFLFPGHALADLAVGALVLDEARAAGTGIRLPR